MAFPTLSPDPFFNRKAELTTLERAWNHRWGGQLSMVYGRRRLGKTFLLQKYFTTGGDNESVPKPHCYYLAEQSTADVQRLALAKRLVEDLPVPGFAPEEIAVSWNVLLRYFSQQARGRPEEQGRIALILDEFPYLVAQSPELPSVIQAWWDQEAVHLPIYVILCGSQLSVMAAIGRESAPLYGRFNAGMLKVEPLRYDDVALFYEDQPNYSLVEKLKMYGILGGTPRYHAMVDTRRPLDEEVVSLLMRPRSILETEVRYLLSSEQIRDPAPYNAVLNAIANGNAQFGHIQAAIGMDSPAVSHTLRTLQELGWVRRELPFGEQSDRRALYRIADPFLHFWYRFVLPLGSSLQFSDPMRVFQTKVELFLADYMGWNVFESICAQWLQKHAETAFGLTIRKMGRYWSRDGQTEIDIVAELEDGSMLFGECKWSAQKQVRIGTVADLQTKVNSLPQKQWRDSAAYVLFSIGDFAQEVRELANSQERLYLVHGGQLL